MAPSEALRVVDVNQIKCIHFGCVAIFSSTKLINALVEFRPFTTMREVKVNQWHELSQFLFFKRYFTDQIAINRELLEGFMLSIGWHKCSTKSEPFGIYRSLQKIEDAKDEWQNQGANLSLVGCILGQSFQYFGDKLFQKIQTCYKSLRVPSFNQVNYEANISTNQGAFELASPLPFTLNVLNPFPHLDKDASLYALGLWVQADKQTGHIQKDASKLCTGGKLVFPNEHFWIYLSECQGLIKVVWAISTFFHYNDPAQDNKSMTLVGMSAQCSRSSTKKMWQKSNGYYEIEKRACYHVRESNKISSQLK
ncbi:hypothetical protein O181_028146 [Austropuccinia psidii MF-1]|uniref:Tet-like 2OG-Fe(II) oxygenase domain-containing protein n=1 Tax=Austropuccinia psidii MF-1 TaxID=1389203 RepID=A0A9Q3CNL0_9BASI|nr:hypothetical protein [Austropuccinia psidii MF-1]